MGWLPLINTTWIINPHRVWGPLRRPSGGSLPQSQLLFKDVLNIPARAMKLRASLIRTSCPVLTDWQAQCIEHPRQERWSCAPGCSRRHAQCIKGTSCYASRSPPAWSRLTVAWWHWSYRMLPHATRSSGSLVTLHTQDVVHCSMHPEHWTWYKELGTRAPLPTVWLSATCPLSHDACW